jgi:hypothetical protein
MATNEAAIFSVQNPLSGIGRRPYLKSMTCYQEHISGATSGGVALCHFMN